jgi:hypothetical protein
MGCYFHYYHVFHLHYSFHTDVVSKEANEKDATIELETIEKRSRAKRAANDELAPR